MTLPWKRTRAGYQLDHSGIRGILRLIGPAPGLRQLSLRRGAIVSSWPGPLLGVQAITAEPGHDWKVGARAAQPGHRLRTNRLDIQLSESSRCPFRVQVYWDAARPNGIDMEVLVTTALEFEQLEVHTHSTATENRAGPKSDCLVPVVSSDRWVGLREAMRGKTIGLEFPCDRMAAAAGPGRRNSGSRGIVPAPPFRLPVICCRPAGRNWSYVEMSHPEDCVRIVARKFRGTIEWRFGLFGLDIEKGVILRGRVRGVFIPRRGDLNRAEKLFKDFVAEPPRLSV